MPANPETCHISEKRSSISCWSRSTSRLYMLVRVPRRVRFTLALVPATHDRVLDESCDPFPLADRDRLARGDPRGRVGLRAAVRLAVERLQRAGHRLRARAERAREALRRPQR